MPVDVGRLIKWLEVTKVIEPEFDFRAQFITDWDACERRRDAGGFEDDNDISPITGNKLCEATSCGQSFNNNLMCQQSFFLLLNALCYVGG